ncbi:MAG: integrase core domain-containing protein [Rhodanobacter sp.]
MPSTIKGRYFYWYMVKDIHSRLLVANEMHACETADHASTLIRKACLRERTTGQPLVVHSDNGSAMKGAVMLATLHELGVASSFSRPRVSNDNAYAEAPFRAAKYCPLWPECPFDTLDEARLWVNRFVAWYNHGHRHSALNYVTPREYPRAKPNNCRLHVPSSTPKRANDIRRAGRGKRAPGISPMTSI